MSTPASFKGHPIHAMLVALPIGLWIFALVADVMTRMGGAEGWRTVAFYSIGGGVVGALLSAVPGLIDLISLRPGIPAHRHVAHGHQPASISERLRRATGFRASVTSARSCTSIRAR